MRFKIRTTAPEHGAQPYAWGVSSEGQCTWGAYYRAIEAGFTPPCWWDRDTKTGSYTNANLWLQNWRDPWEVKGPDYIPVAGDIAVFDGQYGHVIFIERVVGDTATISDWNRVAPLTYASDEWQLGKSPSGIGSLLGYLHYPGDPVLPVERNTEVDQIQTMDDTLRIRTAPSLNADVVGFVQLGYYNVLDQKDADGYTWYEIAKDRWCANITTIYLPADEDEDIIRLIKEYSQRMQNKVKELTEENKDLKNTMKQIHDLSEV